MSRKIVIFTIPKPFKGHTGIIQSNALRSWKRIKGVEIRVLGGEEGLAEFCDLEELHPPVPIKKNHLGTPFLNDAFKKIVNLEDGEVFVYSNADIIFDQKIVMAVDRIEYKKYLGIGKRYNIDVTNDLEFSGEWFEDLRQVSKPYYEHLGKYGSDYFIFPRSAGLDELPEFLVGRPRWDNWMIKNARLRKIPVIDCSEYIYDLHQNHDYGHVPLRSGIGHEGPEAEHNRSLYGEVRFSLADATHWMNAMGKVRKRRSMLALKRYFVTRPAFYPKSRVVRLAAKAAVRLLP